MEDVKVTYTVDGKEFDDYDKAMKYKEEREANEADKEKLVEAILDAHLGLSQLLDKYDALNPTRAEKQELLTKMGINNIKCKDYENDSALAKEMVDTLDDLGALLRLVEKYL